MPPLYHIPDSIYGYEREFGVIFPLIRHHPCNDHICLQRHCHFCFLTLFTFFSLSHFSFLSFSPQNGTLTVINAFIKCIYHQFGYWTDQSAFDSHMIQYGDKSDFAHSWLEWLIKNLFMIISKVVGTISATRLKIWSVGSWVAWAAWCEPVPTND